MTFLSFLSELSISSEYITAEIEDLITSILVFSPIFTIATFPPSLSETYSAIIPAYTINLSPFFKLDIL